MTRNCLRSCFLVLLTALVHDRSNAQSQPASIVYDAKMIPHIFGSTPEAALYALGYHHMRDFPIGTLDMLWRFSGRFGEFVGDEGIEQDKAIRLWEVPAIVARHRAALESANPLGTLPEQRRHKIHQMLLAYVRGVEQGRTWWRNGVTPPSNSVPLRTLIGPNGEVFVDPLPSYLNQGVAAYSDPADADADTIAERRQHIARIIDRFFSSQASLAVTIDNVLAVGIAINSGPGHLYQGGLIPVGELTEVGGTDGFGLGSNGWMASKGAVVPGAGPVLHSDIHVTFNNTQRIRFYMAQVVGGSGPGLAQYKAAGLTMPGFPCVLVGFNDEIAWSTTATPTLGASRNSWSVPMQSGAGFQYQDATGPQTGSVLTFRDTLSAHDPKTGSVTTQHYDRSYAQYPGLPALGFPGDRYPITAASGPLGTGTTITFEQASFTTQANTMWEFPLGLGFADNNHPSDPSGLGVSSVLAEDSLLLFVGVNNFMFADAEGYLRYAWLGKIPVQGSGVTDTSAVLDGARSDNLWSSFYPTSQLPAIGPELVTGDEVWMNNNCSPDRVEIGSSTVADRLTAAQLASFPMITNPVSATTWRQVRGEELLRNPVNRPLALGATAGAVDHHPLASDQQDSWMARMWEFFVVACNGQGPNETAFCAWVEGFKGWTEGGSAGGPAFIAHRFSIVTPYTTLLRAFYEKELEALNPAGSLAATLGSDPVHPLFATGSSGFDPVVYADNYSAMRSVLTSVTGLWMQRFTSSGLRNFAMESALVAGATPAGPNLYTSNPWGHPGFSTGNTELQSRWGRFNMMSLTPHGIPPPKQSTLALVNPALHGMTALSYFRAFLLSDLYPDNIAATNCEPGASCLLRKFKTPTNLNPTTLKSDPLPAVYPIGGVPDSLFLNARLDFTQNGFRSDEGLYDFGSAGKFLYVPKTAGSGMLFTVQLGAAGANGYYLAALGGTEVSKVFPATPWQKRFGPSADFAETSWQPLHTETSAITPEKVIDVSYTP